MKKRFLSLGLALVLLLALGTTVLAGSSGESLISQSYLEGTFFSQLMAAVSEKLSQRPGGGSGRGVQTVSVSAGGSVRLGQGETVVLLSGKARVSLNGSLVNASLGLEAANGALNPGQRYLVCEDSSADIRVLEDAVLALSGGAEVTQGSGADPGTGAGGASPFTDVAEGAWYYADVLAAYERGLVNGMTATTYAPNGTLTAGQCVKLAACMHQLWHEGAVTLENSPSGPWYRSYVDYALANGILKQEFADYNAVIVRQQFVSVFYNALPGSCYTQINDIADGAIPDVQATDASAYEIYVFYRAGILTGYTDGSFDPGATISRAEVATIMNRMMDESARKSFRLG